MICKALIIYTWTVRAVDSFVLNIKHDLVVHFLKIFSNFCPRLSWRHGFYQLSIF